MDQGTVLIIADDAEFSRAVVNRWRTERTIPAFTLLNPDVWEGNSGIYDLAIVGVGEGTKLAPILQVLDQGPNQRTIICVCKSASFFQQVKDNFPRVLALRQHEGWLDALLLVASEVLRRMEAVQRATRAEDLAHSQAHYATLGRYMLDMRHSLNNALTSVLGNAELLLLEPGELSTQVRDQVDTIHNMALRMHEILQRFSSLDVEMNCAEKKSQCETPVRAHRLATGS
jgi:signal transduction histidine kinase